MRINGTKLEPAPNRPPIPLERLPSSGKGPAFATVVDGACEVVEVDTWTQTKEGDQLRRARMARRLSLRDAATLLGLSVLQLSHLERGVMTTSEEAWLWIHASIGGVRA